MTLAEFVGVDLCLLRTQVDVLVEVQSVEKIQIERLPFNEASRWRVRLPSPFGDLSEEDYQAWVFAGTTTILLEISLLPERRFFEILESLFQSGLMSKLVVAKPYSTLFREFVSRERFDELRRGFHVLEEHRSFEERPTEKMDWFNGPGPGYTVDESKEMISARYVRLLPAIRLTLARLRKDKDFSSVVRSLRRDGWLDWHILMAVHGAVVNYRVQRCQEPVRNPDDQKRHIDEFQKLAWREETEEDEEVPRGLLTEEHLRLMLQSSMGSTLKVLGLECRQATPDFTAIDDFLRERFGYWHDDVPHEDPLKID